MNSRTRDYESLYEANNKTGFNELFQGKLGCFNTEWFKFKEEAKSYHGKPFLIFHIHKPVTVTKAELVKNLAVNPHGYI